MPDVRLDRAPLPRTDLRTVSTAVRRILKALDADHDREGLARTPDRYANFLGEFLRPHAFTLTTFENEGTDEMIVQTRIPFFSLCEHHLAPFFGTAAVAYIPQGRIVGLSKLARVVQWHARAFQNQERITEQVATTLEEALAPRGVAVLLEARHLCMEMRGVRTHDTPTTTSCTRGLFRDDPRTRSEFFSIVRAK